MAFLNRQYTALAGGAVNTTTSLIAPPGADGLAGPNILVLDSLEGSFTPTTTNASAYMQLQLFDANAATAVWTKRILANSVTGAPTPISIHWPQGGPRISTSAPQLITAAGNSLAANGVLIGISYHFEP
jgi:hypothetical protein